MSLCEVTAGRRVDTPLRVYGLCTSCVRAVSADAFVLERIGVIVLLRVSAGAADDEVDVNVGVEEGASLDIALLLPGLVPMCNLRTGLLAL